MKHIVEVLIKNRIYAICILIVIMILHFTLLFSSYEYSSFVTHNLSARYFKGLHLETKDYKEYDFSSSNMSSSWITLSSFRNCNLKYTRLSNSILYNSRFVNCNMQSAKLDFCNLTHCTFYRDNLNNTTFQKSDLQGAIFFDVDLSHVDFNGTNLEGCTYNFSTRFAPSFDPVKHSMVRDDSEPNINAFKYEPAIR